MQLIFEHPPRRVITFWQNSTETLLALGLQDRIVAAVGIPYRGCIKEEYQQAYDSIPIKQMQILDKENILMLRPDFILGWGSTFRPEYIGTTEFWRSREINTYIASSTTRSAKAKTIEDEYKYIMDMGTIFGRRKRASALVKQMERELAFVENRTAGHKKPRTIIMEKQKDILRLYGRNTLAGDILTKVNGDIIDIGATISYEQLIAENPEVIFLIVSENDYRNASVITQQIYENPALQDIIAVREHRIYTLPLFMVYSSAVRTYDGIREMAQDLYPELYEEVPQN
ncbi:ABC transporter substrate-binding protein [Pectinatus haikarae]|uniref:ABC transporter substrate-binding protein n=1 Tax=Pectinatus haikarae TaxID=349096 RepID=UPI0018C4F5F4|nr:ABC transporter substrate-binding protein [Pectinatus haikarae]